MSKRTPDYQRGEQVGRLTIIKVDRSKPGRRPRVIATCECGNPVNTELYSVRRGDSLSCGCLRVDTHTTHGESGTGKYGSWEGMVQRSGDGYYGTGHYASVGRSPLWDTYEGFLADPPSGEWFPGAELCRTGDEGDYEPSNCRWDTRQGNLEDMRKHFMSDGRPGLDVALANGISKAGFYTRLGKGETVDEAATRPTRRLRGPVAMGDGRDARQVALSNGIKRTTFDARLDRGMSPDEAATKPV